MDARNKVGIKSGLLMALFWFVWGVISNWRELHTPGIAKVKLIWLIAGTIVVALIFGLFTRRQVDPFGRHISIRSEDKSNSEESTK
jgi:hypothetical protein